jgi:hypothetical protein
MKMSSIAKFIVAAGLLFCDTNSASAKEHENAAGGTRPDTLFLLSPDGKWELNDNENVFVINPRGTSGTFFSDDIPQLEPSLEHTARYATWSPNSRMIAVCVRTAKYVMDTFVLIHQGQYDWRCVALPYDDPEAWAIPLRWTDANTLVIEISGPRESKAEELQSEKFYIYDMTVKYDEKHDRFVKISSSKKAYPDRGDN